MFCPTQWSSFYVIKVTRTCASVAFRRVLVGVLTVGHQSQRVHRVFNIFRGCLVRWSPDPACPSCFCTYFADVLTSRTTVVVLNFVFTLCELFALYRVDWGVSLCGLTLDE